MRMKHTGENVVRIEAEALRALADRIGGPMAGAFQRAVELMFGCAGRVVVTGMGKSGLIARKIAATLSSTGSPALYLHPVDAMHGDLGMVVRGDVVLALSASGETEEILQLLATIKRLRVPLIAMTGDEICGAQPSASAKGGAAAMLTERNIPTSRARARGAAEDRGLKSKPQPVSPKSRDKGGAPASMFDLGCGGGGGVGLFDCGGGLFAGAGSDGFDYDDAGAGGCAGGDVE